MTSLRTVGYEGGTTFPQGLGSFEAFCEGLRRDLGIPFGPDHEIRLATLCGRLALRGVVLRTADEVAWHFAPVIATDAKSQAAVQQQIRDVWERTDAVEEPADDAPVLSETKRVERDLADVDKGRRKWRKALRIVFGLVSVFLGGLLIYELLAPNGLPAPDPLPLPGPDLPLSDLSRFIFFLVQLLFGVLFGGHTLILAALVLLAGAVAIAWMSIRSVRQGVLRGPSFRSGDGTDLHFEGLGIEFFSTVSGPRSVDALARHRELPARGIDVESSVVRTVRSGGLVHIVPRTVRRLPQYLILSSRESADDHHAGLAEDLQARLAERQVFARHYEFNGSPLKAWEVGKASGSVGVHGFGDLLALAETHAWILIDDTEDLFDPADRSIYGWVRALAAAAPGVLMTSKPGNAWSWREAALKNEGIKVLSAMVADLRDAADFLSGQTTLVVSRHGWPVEHTAYRHLKRMMDALPADSDEAPSAETQEKFIRHLRGYFAFAAEGEATFELFVATCIYPELKPALTRMIARAVRDDVDRRLASEVGLGALFALPWFRVGRIPQWLREKAVDSVDAERRAKLEQCVHAVLFEPEDRGRLNLKVAGRYPGLIAENLYRLLPRDSSARRDDIFVASLRRAPGPGVFGVSKAFVRRAVGSSHEALGILAAAAMAVTAIGIALYAMFSPSDGSFPTAGVSGVAVVLLAAISDFLTGAWMNLLLVSGTVVGGTALIVSVGLRQVSADARVVRSLWQVGAWFLVGVAVLAMVAPVSDSQGPLEEYLAPLWVFAMATLYVTYVLQRPGGERISVAAWQGIARGRIVAGIVVAYFVVLFLAAAGRAIPSFMSPLPEGAQQPVFAAIGAVLLAASAGRAIGLGVVGLLATGATFTLGYLAGWALVLDMSARFGFSPGSEATLILAGQTGLMFAAITIAFHLARHGLDLRAPVVIGALLHVSLTSALYASGLSLAFAFAAVPLTVVVGFLIALGGDMVRAPATGRPVVTDAWRRWRYSLGSFVVVAMAVPAMGYIFDVDEITTNVDATLLALCVLWVWPVLRGGLQACVGAMEAKPPEMAWDVSGRRWIWLCVPVLWALLACRYEWSEWRLTLDFLCVPVAIWLGACHGRMGLWVCALGFIPLVTDIRVDAVSSSGWIAGYFASLLACRYAGSSEFRRACFSARRLSRQQLVFLAIGFCFLVSIWGGMGSPSFNVDNYLGFYVLAIVFLIGTSRIDLDEFIVPVAAVWLLLFATMLFRSEEFHFPNFGPFSFVPAFSGVGYMVSVLGFFALGRLFRRWIASPEMGAAVVAPLAVVCFVVMVLYGFGVAGRHEFDEPDVSFVFRIDPIGYSLAWALIFALGVIGGGRGVVAAIAVLAAVKVGIPVVVNVLPLSGVLPVAESGWTAPVLDLRGEVTPYWRNFWGVGGLQYELGFGWTIGVGDFLLALAGWRVHKAIMNARRAGRWKKEVEAATRRVQPFGAAEPPLLTPNSYFDIAVPVAKVGLVLAVVMLVYNAGRVLYSVAFL